MVLLEEFFWKVDFEKKINRWQTSKKNDIADSVKLFGFGTKRKWYDILINVVCIQWVLEKNIRLRNVGQ